MSRRPSIVSLCLVVILSAACERPPSEVMAPDREFAAHRSDADDQVTAGISTVLATQSPVEREGNYPLLKARLDQIMVQLAVGARPNGSSPTRPPPRAQYHVLAAKARAAMDRRATPDLEHVAAMAQPLSYRVVVAEAEGGHCGELDHVGEVKSASSAQSGASQGARPFPLRINILAVSRNSDDGPVTVN